MMKITLRISSIKNNFLSFIIPFSETWNSVNALVEKAKLKHNGYMNIEITLPHRPRSKGKRSQNSRIWGMCGSIAYQLNIEVQEVYQAMKKIAVENGYPVVNVCNIITAKSQTKASVEEAGILIATIQEFADSNNLWLIEYDDDGKICRTLGGEKIEN